MRFAGRRTRAEPASSALFPSARGAHELGDQAANQGEGRGGMRGFHHPICCLNTKQNGIFAGQTKENRRAEDARGANEAGKNGHRIRIVVAVEKEETPEGHFECGDRWRPWRSQKWATTGMLVLIQR